MSVLIVGGGLAGQRVAETLRRRGYDAPVRMLCAEDVPPYDRPPLSKEMTAHPLRPAAWYGEQDVELRLGDPAVALRERTVTTASGATLSAEHVVIATGSVPRRLPAFAGFENVHELRTVGDAERLGAGLAPGVRLAIVGAGFIGQEVAASARARGAAVTLVEALPAPLLRVVGPRLGAWFAQLHREEGVDVVLGSGVAQVEGVNRVEALVLADGRRVVCDHVLVAVGVVPAVDWLAGASLDHPGVHVVGDAAGTHHWEAAARSGAAAAHAILGLEPPRDAIPSFWSDQYGLRIHLVGDPAGADGLELDGEGRSFAATFTRAGRPLAALLVDRAHELPHHRRRLSDPEPEEKAA